MHTIHELTVDQRAALVSSCYSWGQLAVRVEPIERPAIVAAVSKLYHELLLPDPVTVLFFGSPLAALKAYPLWASVTGSTAAVLWNYQLPLCDPDGYWRQHSGWPDLDLAVTRRPNSRKCYAHGEALPCDGNILSAGVHKQIWDSVLACLGEPSWCDTLVDDLEDHEVIEALAERLDAEDPTSQARPLDYFALGPRSWLLREVAALEFASGTLMCRTNNQLLQALVGILRSGSLLFTFERLVVAIERPIAFNNGRAIYPA